MAFDRKLPKIDESDLTQLQTAFPEHQSQLNMPSTVEMPTIGKTDAGQVPKDDQIRPNMEASRECYISTSDKTTWTFSTSPPEPAPNFQTTDKPGDKRPVSDETQQGANETTFEEISKDGGEKSGDKTASVGSPSTGLTSFEDTSVSPELGKY